MLLLLLLSSLLLLLLLLLSSCRRCRCRCCCIVVVVVVVVVVLSWKKTIFTFFLKIFFWRPKLTRKLKKNYNVYFTFSFNVFFRFFQPSRGPIWIKRFLFVFKRFLIVFSCGRRKSSDLRISALARERFFLKFFLAI